MRTRPLILRTGQRPRLPARAEPLRLASVLSRFRCDEFPRSIGPLINRSPQQGRFGDSNALEISPDDPMMLYNCACLHARLGETQRALELLRQAIARGHLNFGWMRNDPDKASLRDNPEFIALTAGQIAPNEPG